jgi:hypothetical protein
MYEIHSCCTLLFNQCSWMFTYFLWLCVSPSVMPCVDLTEGDTHHHRNYASAIAAIPWAIIPLKSTNFWDITPCSPLKVSWRFGGIYRLHLQGWRISQERNQREGRWQAEGSDMFPKRQLSFNGLHDVISQKVIFFNHRCEKPKSYKNLTVTFNKVRNA